ncbi:hypothetical protein R5H30_15810 [Sulfitobacter sp. D35]|uniref:hypothetical protein n=1 Tax=Sulfitobacter sp. D35 TaxID=3083252 RepID=UPI00296F353E|nr:hypothetical protein [Sulfitobacter sp. D35]MDW4499458.1 hypothetical protein [Sulfitobacter sp. D35]
MTHRSFETPRVGRQFDYKFWTIVSLVLLAFGYNVAKELVLDADDADISYDRLFVSSTRVIDPHPGDVFIYNHADSAFVPSKVCSLQIFGAPPAATQGLRASNVWGSSVNATLASVGGYVGDKITGLATVKNAERHWTYSWTHRPQVRAPMEEDCFEDVKTAALKSGVTPFVVDAVYRVDNAGGTSSWVRFANPLILDPSTCETCPKPVSLRDVVRGDRITRFKANWGLVRVE